MRAVQTHEIGLRSCVRLAAILLASAAGIAAFGSVVVAAQIVSRFKQQFPLTGATVDVTKVIDNSTGKGTLTAVDEHGQAVSFEAVQSKENNARIAKYAKLDPKLAERLRTASGGKPIPVSIWLKVPAGFEPKRVQDEEPVKALSRVQVALAPARRTLVSKLKRMGGRNVTSAPNGPAVFARLTPAQIKRAAALPEVDTIYPQEIYRNFQDDSATTERINVVWAQGDLGQGTIRPAIHEPDAVSDGNPNLNNATHAVVFYCGAVNSLCPAGKNVGSSGGHASRVAGAIASTHPLDRGIAPNVQLVISENSQTFNDSDLVSANEWGRGNGADPTNMSWGSTCPDGQQTFMSRYVDFAVRNFGQTFTISSGNSSGCVARDLQVSSPGVAFSAITVGAIRDSNDGFWSNDSISTFSRFQNPDFAPDLNKPEVVAVGQDQCLTNDSGIDCGNAGTSFSAPQVAGQVASMLSRQPGQSQWPETNKAAVLVSAFHPIGTADQSGLGGVVMKVSDDTYRLGRFINECNATCNPLGVGDFDSNGNRDHLVRVCTQ